MTFIIFHHFPGLENGLPKFRDFPWSGGTLFTAPTTTLNITPSHYLDYMTSSVINHWTYNIWFPTGNQLKTTNDHLLNFASDRFREFWLFYGGHLPATLPVSDINWWKQMATKHVTDRCTLNPLTICTVSRTIIYRVIIKNNQQYGKKKLNCTDNKLHSNELKAWLRSRQPCLQFSRSSYLEQSTTARSNSAICQHLQMKLEDLSVLLHHCH